MHGDGMNGESRHPLVHFIWDCLSNTDETCASYIQDDAAEAEWFNIMSLPELAFDHKLVRSLCLPDVLRGITCCGLYVRGLLLCSKTRASNCSSPIVYA